MYDVTHSQPPFEGVGVSPLKSLPKALTQVIASRSTTPLKESGLERPHTPFNMVRSALAEKQGHGKGAVFGKPREHLNRVCLGLTVNGFLLCEPGFARRGPSLEITWEFIYKEAEVGVKVYDNIIKSRCIPSTYIVRTRLLHRPIART